MTIQDGLNYASTTVAVAAVISAALPQYSGTAKVISVIQQIINILGMNFANAKNADAKGGAGGK